MMEAFNSGVALSDSEKIAVRNLVETFLEVLPPEAAGLQLKRAAAWMPYDPERRQVVMSHIEGLLKQIKEKNAATIFELLKPLEVR
jgi:hypothetical protein